MVYGVARATAEPQALPVHEAPALAVKTAPLVTLPRLFPNESNASSVKASTSSDGMVRPFGEMTTWSSAPACTVRLAVSCNPPRSPVMVYGATRAAFDPHAFAAPNEPPHEAP